MKPGPTARPFAERFWPKVNKTETCWLWSAAKDARTGYGYFSIARSIKGLAHRIAYELVKGPIPEGLELDHLCRKRDCVNPDHLQAVTRRVNQLRGFSVSGLNARRTHCPQGHPYDEGNTYIEETPRGQTRRCRECLRVASRLYMRRYLGIPQSRWQR